MISGSRNEPHHPLRALRPDLDALLDTVLPAAQERLRKTHHLVPFAARLDAKGGVHLEEYCLTTVKARTPEAMQALLECLRHHAQKGDLRAAAICACGPARHPEHHEMHESIIVTLEHHAGLAARVCQPFHQDFLGLYHFGTLFTLPSESSIFAHDAG